MPDVGELVLGTLQWFSRIPLGRGAEADQVADVIAFLAGHEALRHWREPAGGWRSHRLEQPTEAGVGGCQRDSTADGRGPADLNSSARRP